MALGQDFRYALRVLAKAPGFTAIAVLTLALGVGASTAIFSVVNGVLLRPLPYGNADRIVALNTYLPQQNRTSVRVTGGDLVDIRAERGLFDSMSYYFGGEMGVQLSDRAEFTGVYFVNPGFFPVFGVQPIAGQLLREGQTSGAVVNAGFAQRLFGSPANALGKTLRVEQRAYEITGVLPEGFRFPQKADIWLPAPVTPTNVNRTAYNYQAIATLTGTLESARAQLSALSTRLESAHPVTKNKVLTVTPLREQMVGQIRSTLMLFLGAVLLVLLISCSNVANLMLARATSRSREMAVRAALGASRGVLVRQLFLESLLLAIGGGLLGFFAADGGVGLLLRLAPANLPRLSEVTVDSQVFFFSLALSAGASLFFGLVPALRASRVDLNETLKQGGGKGSLGGRSGGLRNGLVVAEIALAVVLAVGAGLLFRSFLALHSVNLGYRTEGVLVMYAHLPAQSDQELRKATHSFEQLFEELKALPGVISVSSAMGLPTGQYGSNGAFAVEGKHRFEPGQVLPQAGFRLTSPGYFATMGIPLIKGRDFTERDQYEASFVAIVSEALVKEVFPNEDPIGKRVQCGLDSPKWMTVVGVVGNVRQQSPASTPGSELYMPFQQHPSYANELQVVLRTAGATAGLTGPVRDAVRRRNPDMAMKFTTMETMVSDSISAPRFRTSLVSTFAIMALLLAMAGVYGVMAYLVTQRTPEIGLRVALGATPTSVVRMVLAKAGVLAVIGLTLGIGLSFALQRVVATMLFGVEPMDLSTYAVVTGAIAAITLLAGLVPAWRASRIDPLEALREN